MNPRILFVASRLPYPLDGGTKQRMFHLVTALASVGEVDLVCYEHPDDGPVDPRRGPLGDLCRDVHVLPCPAERWPDPARSYRDVLERYVRAPKPYLVSAFPGGALAERVATLSEKADLVWVERIFVAAWLTRDLDKTIVDLDDIESEKERRRLALERFRPWHLPLRWDNARLRRLERSAPRRYASVAVCSETDRAFFAPSLRDRVLVVPNGVPARLLSRPRSLQATPTIVFVGQMRYGPNLEAALWLARDIFPRIAAAVPGVRLCIVGAHKSPALTAVHDGTRVVVTGRVDDVEPFVSGAAVSVAPIRVAGGTRIKILESLALGTPVVSTTIGAEGLGLVAGRHLRIADTAEGLASEVVALLGDAQAREALSRAGRAVVAERYTWEAVGRRLASTLDAHLSVRTGTSPHRAGPGLPEPLPARSGIDGGPVDVTVAVCTYNRADSLRRTLEALAAQTVPADVAWELLVIDNNSRDATPAVVEEFARGGRVPVAYAFEPRQGLSWARNTAIARARGAIIAFTDDDVRPDPDWVAAVARAVRSLGADVVGGRALPVWSRPAPPWLRERETLHNNLGLMDYEGLVTLTPGVTRPRIWGCNMAFTRSALAALGAFSVGLGVQGEKRFAGEDTDMIRRAMAAGLRVVYDSRLTVWHEVQPERMRRSYFRRWRFQDGQGAALAMGPRSGRRCLGVSFFAYRLVLERLGAWLAAVARRRGDAFVKELELAASAGRWWGEWQAARSGREGTRP
jgi:glycosyltransferase involved in cell wall biosynthesis